MKKLLMVLASACACVMMFASCGGNATVKNLDVAGLADELAAKVEFKDSMSPVEKEMALILYNMTDDNVEDMKLYMSTRATAEEIAVIKAAEGKEADVKKSVEARIEAQREAYTDYNSIELTKLQEPTVFTSGSYVVLCISDDDAASLKIIEEYVK